MKKHAFYFLTFLSLWGSSSTSLNAATDGVEPYAGEHTDASGISFADFIGKVWKDEGSSWEVEDWKYKDGDDPGFEINGKSTLGIPGTAYRYDDKRFHGCSPSTTSSTTAGSGLDDDDLDEPTLSKMAGIRDMAATKAFVVYSFLELLRKGSEDPLKGKVLEFLKASLSTRLRTAEFKTFGARIISFRVPYRDNLSNSHASTNGAEIEVGVKVEEESLVVCFYLQRHYQTTFSRRVPAKSSERTLDDALKGAYEGEKVILEDWFFKVEIPFTGDPLVPNLDPFFLTPEIMKERPGGSSHPSSSWLGDDLLGISRPATAEYGEGSWEETRIRDVSPFDSAGPRAAFGGSVGDKLLPIADGGCRAGIIIPEYDNPSSEDVGD